MNDRQQERSQSGLWGSFVSVLAAFFGVQSEKNRQKDFTEGKFWHFAVMGVVGTLLFILLVWFAVRLVLYSA